MKQSALFLALILIGTNQPAHGSQLVVAEEDVAASTGNETLPQETPAVEGPVAGPLAADTNGGKHSVTMRDNTVTTTVFLNSVTNS